MLRILRRALVPLLILALAVGGFLALRATGPESPPREASERTWPVRAITAEPGTHRPIVMLNGRVRSPSNALLRAAVAGEVAAVPARAGQRVAAGDVLVRLDPREAQLLLDQREAERREQESALVSEQVRARFDRSALARERELLEIAERGLRRAQSLRADNVGSEADVDAARERVQQVSLTVDSRERAVAEAPARIAQAEARLERARAAEAQARIDLERTTIRAAFDARIVEVEVAEGERARPGDPLLRLFALDDLEIRASLPEPLLARIRELLAQGAALPARARVDGQEVTAELLRLEGETRAGEAGLRGVFRIQAGGESLPLNRFVQLRLRLPPEPDSVAVPFEALFGRDQIFRIRDGRLEPLSVRRLGQLVDDDGNTLALIRHPDVRAGDRLLATRLPNAVAGLRVDVQDRDAAP
ncbi:efflux RND transporter periplasmic adaptor subunit [Sediminicurvatus halobius]|uniref:RND transporter n=1 Tax=Sediminicurvatus halobius TaxID=2182432 RepID=A0A2U2N486_9GAMM|nr:biotin/lipoyl-binding protein [Spiribacter halobius]PWG64031.1 RND transporter [Spiribacter halobius]UEX76915.1 biotin/lipoyl-binding protein [Spiribacter halobius]